MQRIRTLISCVIICFSLSRVHAAMDPTLLTIETNSIRKVFTKQELLTEKNIEYIKMSNSRAYPKTPMTFIALKLCDLLRALQVSKNDMVEFIATDNFIAVVPADKILACDPKHAIAMLAIEPTDLPWPKLKYNNPDQNHPDEGTAGPYQIIWLHPEKSYISNEYWAWKVNKIKIHKNADTVVAIPSPLINNPHVQNGYHMYVSHCMGCHTINHLGKTTIGPDLNISHNSFKNDAQLKQFIRDPQSVRIKNNDRMSGTDEVSLSNTDLDDLILYLHHMTNDNNPLPDAK